MSNQVDAIEIWDIPFRDVPGWREVALQTLAADERERAMRYKLPSRADEFIFFRWAMRCLLAEKLAIAPRDVPIAVGPQGKPYLAGLKSPPWFNIAHASTRALLAISWLGEVGIDVEPSSASLQLESLAHELCASGERDAWRSYPPHERTMWLLHLWTAKEAVLKGTAKGLSIPLTSVTINPGDEVCSTGVIDEPTDAAIHDQRWLVRSGMLAGEFHYAVAYQGSPDVPLVFHDATPLLRQCLNCVE